MQLHSIRSMFVAFVVLSATTAFAFEEELSSTHAPEATPCCEPTQDCELLEFQGLPCLCTEMLNPDLADWFLHGHLQQGVNTNAHHPINPPNGLGNQPGIGFAYRADQYQLNQLYLSVGKVADTSQSPFAVGGGIDVLYGTDYTFLESLGLEKERDGTSKWNGDSGSSFSGGALHGVVMPQLYADFAYETLTIKVGHFYNVFGYEEVLPTHNFYYTTSYSLFYNGSGESAPVTGILAQWQMTPELKIAGGFHRGVLKWEDNNNVLNAIGLVEWTTPNKDIIVTYSCDIGAEDDAGQNTIYGQSIVFEWQFAEKTSYVLHSSYGFEERDAMRDGIDQWFGFGNYLAHQLTDNLVAGSRYEYFNDLDGSRVSSLEGAYHALTLGLNYSPHAKVTIRPEVRHDWFDADGQQPSGPYDNGNKRSQFVAAVDVVITF